MVRKIFLRRSVSIVLIGEIGGSTEEEAAEVIKREITKPGQPFRFAIDKSKAKALPT